MGPAMSGLTKVHLLHKQLHQESAVLQCHHLRVNQGCSTGDIAEAVVSISQGRADCWCILLIGALTTHSDERRVLGSFLEIQEGKAPVFGHQLLEYHLVDLVTNSNGDPENQIFILQAAPLSLLRELDLNPSGPQALRVPI